MTDPFSDGLWSTDPKLGRRGSYDPGTGDALFDGERIKRVTVEHNGVTYTLWADDGSGQVHQRLLPDGRVAIRIERPASPRPCSVRQLIADSRRRVSSFFTARRRRNTERETWGAE